MTDEPKSVNPKAVNYGSNSNKSQTPPPDAVKPAVKQIVSAEGVKERKTPLAKKFFSAYAGDDAQSVGSYLLFDVIVPATKNIISDIVSQGIERLLFGQVRSRTTSSGSIVGTRAVNYGQYSSRPQQQQTAPVISQREREMHDFSQYLVYNRGEAEMVIEQLQSLIEEYGVATVADFYASISVTAQHTDNKWGWTSLGGARAVNVRDGYVFDLPRPILLP